MVNNTECFTYNEEELNILRKITYLNIISKLRINMIKKESSEILEYDLRVKKWIKSCTKAWEKYIETENDRFGLDEFSKKALSYCKIKTKGK